MFKLERENSRLQEHKIKLKDALRTTLGPKEGAGETYRMLEKGTVPETKSRATPTKRTN
jgi:hypothetical protein